MRNDMDKELQFLRGLPKDEARRIAYLEGREDLFRTKLLRIESEHDTEELGLQRICVLSRDPGSGNALAPVINILRQERGIALSALADGRAEEIFKKQFPVVADESGREGLDALKAIESPNLFLTGPSEEPGIEVSAVATYPEVPMVLLDIYYGDSLRLFDKLKKRGLPFPAKVCVMDEEAARINIEHYPELKDRIEITGLPSFDRFANEDTEGISRRTRERLGIALEEKLVVWMAPVDMTKEFLSALAKEISQSKTSLTVIFRKHPRDSTSYEAYHTILKGAGLRYVDTQAFTSDEIGAAADLVLITTSTEGLNAIYRRKPSIHINDERYRKLYPGVFLPLPQVRSGASVGTENVAELSVLVDELLDPQSVRNAELKRNMEAHYPRDGKNAERVVQVIKEVLAENTK